MRVDERPDRDRYSAKTSSPGDVRGDSAADPDALSAPVLVHHCTDEKTLSVAARHLARIEGDTLRVEVKLENVLSYQPRCSSGQVNIP